MGDKEPNDEVLNCVNMPGCSLDDLLKDYEECIHTHTCNPPVADLPHTHTCVHVHTQVLPDDKVGVGSDDAQRKSNKGNKEATRRYRKRKKDESDLLKEEVVRLKAENQQLKKRLEGEATENLRSKFLLADIRGRIEVVIGSFPFQNSVNPNTGTMIPPAAYVVNPCNMQGNDQACCLPQGGTPLNGCEFQPMQCLANQDPGFK